MAVDNIDSVHGASYVFGFPASDVALFTGLTNGSGFTPRTVSSSDKEPEVFVTATNGEGFVEAVAIATAANKMISVSVSGYVSAAFLTALQNNTVGNSFTLFSRFFFVKKISDPRQKGNFIEVQIDGQSYPLVTS